MEWIKNQIKKVFPPGYRVSFNIATTTVSGIKHALGLDNQTIQDDEYHMNMSPYECSDCKWIYRSGRNTCECYYYPPQVVDRDDIMNSSINSVRPTVKEWNKACSKFEMWSAQKIYQVVGHDGDGV